jgi:UDP-GlcNAc3NAcA epimerase
MKILTVVGARPQFVKAAAVSRAFNNMREDIKELIVHTGQHYDANMSDIFFEEMDIPKPHINLGVGGGTHGQNTGRMIEQLEGVLISERPDWLLVYGDTDSTLAGALAATKLQIPIAHVEAGLRSFNMSMPEEINRVLSDKISTVLFCPTEVAVSNLMAEGIVNKSDRRIINTGDVMLDAAMHYSDRARAPSSELVPESDFILCTLHRAENTNNRDKLASIVKNLNEASLNQKIIFPIHPRTKKYIDEYGLTLDCTNIQLIPPVGYFEMLWLLKNCCGVVTDSGGLQKEAYFFGKPCVTVRDQTEWVELISVGANRLVDALDDSLAKSLDGIAVLDTKDVFSSLLYGDANAASKIVSAF